MQYFINSIIVFSVVLIITKSKILAGKRKFVEERYLASKVDNQKPGIIHIWWHAFWTCSMCCGFWISLLVAYLAPISGLVSETLFYFGMNWLLHCMESLLFFSAENYEKKNQNTANRNV